MGDISRHFNRKDFDCKCGCQMPPEVLSNVLILVKQLQALRDALDWPIIVNSGYRCVAHNKAIGGKANSQHLLGKAADIRAELLVPEDIRDTIEVFIDDGIMLQGGLGLYKTFVHYDIRKKRARW